MNVLSVAAAYGVLVIVFQYGWFDSIIGFDHLGYVNALTPPLLLAIVFGLSMDYEVFLLSRIRSATTRPATTGSRCRQGLAASAKTISSAAIIMVAVFAIFALHRPAAGQGDRRRPRPSRSSSTRRSCASCSSRPRWSCMGDWNWWLPSWLDRILPDMDFESSPEPVVERRVEGDRDGQADADLLDLRQAREREDRNTPTMMIAALESVFALAASLGTPRGGSPRSPDRARGSASRKTSSSIDQPTPMAKTAVQRIDVAEIGRSRWSCRSSVLEDDHGTP